MPSLNKAQLIGHLGASPEMRFLTDGGAVANFTLATSESWKDKSGAKIERTDWHKVSIFGKLAEIAGEYLKKGSLVYIEGRLQTRKWQGKDGQDRYTTEIVADRMQLLDRKPVEAPAPTPIKAPLTDSARHFDDFSSDEIPF